MYASNQARTPSHITNALFRESEEVLSHRQKIRKRKINFATAFSIVCCACGHVEQLAVLMFAVGFLQLYKLARGAAERAGTSMLQKKSALAYLANKSCQSFQFLGNKGDRTLFTIRARSIIDIRDFSSVQDEDELLLLPATMMIVKGCLDAGNGLTMIQLEEDIDGAPLLDFVHPGLSDKKAIDAAKKQRAEAAAKLAEKQRQEELRRQAELQRKAKAEQQRKEALARAKQQREAAAQKETQRLAAQKEAQRIAAEKEAQRLAAEEEAARRKASGDLTHTVYVVRKADDAGKLCMHTNI